MIRQLPADVRSYLRSGVALASATQCVEELVLNAVDAGASCVAVRVDLAAFKVQVVDNGSGVAEDQLALMGERYATSKCHLLKDLNNLCYYGYRGEALASIRDSCGILEIMTRTKASSKTYCKMFQNGRALKVTESAIPRPSVGTTVTVHDLFSNFPVRRKSTNQGLELEKIRQRLEALALLKPHVSVSLRNDVTGTVILQTHKGSSVVKTFAALFGPDKAKTLVEVGGSQGNFTVKGFIGIAAHTKKDLQFVFINGRLVLKTKIHKSVNQAMAKSVIFKRSYGQNANTPEITQRQSVSTSPTKFLEKHPVYVLDIECPLTDYDITFDPAKTLVEFKDWDSLLQCITEMVNTFLKKENLATSPDLADSAKDTVSTEQEDEALAGRISPTMLQGTLTSRKVKKRVIESPSSSENPFKTPHTMSIEEWKAKNQMNTGEKTYASEVDSSFDTSTDDPGNNKMAKTDEHDSNDARSMTSASGDATDLVDKPYISENMNKAENQNMDRNWKKTNLLAEKKLSCFSKEKRESFLSVNKLNSAEKHANLQRQGIETLPKDVIETCRTGVKESSEPQSSLSLFRKAAAKPNTANSIVSIESNSKRESTSGPQITSEHCLSSLQRFRKGTKTVQTLSSTIHREESGAGLAAEICPSKNTHTDNSGKAQPSFINNPQRVSAETRQHSYKQGDFCEKRRDFCNNQVNVPTGGVNKRFVTGEPSQINAGHINMATGGVNQGAPIGYPCPKDYGDINIGTKEVNNRMVVDEASQIDTNTTAVSRDSRKRLNEIRDPSATKAAKLSRLVRERTSSVAIQPDLLLLHAKTGRDVQSLQAYQYKRPGQHNIPSTSTSYHMENLVQPRTQYNPGRSTSTSYHTDNSSNPRTVHNQDYSYMHNKLSRCNKEPAFRSSFGISHQQPMSFSATHTNDSSQWQYGFEERQSANENHWGSKTEGKPSTSRTSTGTCSAGFPQQHSIGETRQGDVSGRTSVTATATATYTDIQDINADVSKQLLDTALSSAFYEQSKLRTVAQELDKDGVSEDPKEKVETQAVEHEGVSHVETIQEEERSIGTALYRAVPMDLTSSVQVLNAARKETINADEFASNRSAPMDLATSEHVLDALRQDTESSDKVVLNRETLSDLPSFEHVLDAVRQDTDKAPSDPAEHDCAADDHNVNTQESQTIVDSEQFGISTQGFSPALSQASLNSEMTKINLNMSQGFTPVVGEIESPAQQSDTGSVNDETSTWKTPKSEGFSPQLDLTLQSPFHTEIVSEGVEIIETSEPPDDEMKVKEGYPTQLLQDNCKTLVQLESPTQFLGGNDQSTVQSKSPTQLPCNDDQSVVQPENAHTNATITDSFLSTCSQNTLDVTVDATGDVTTAGDIHSHEGEPESNDTDNLACSPVSTAGDISVTQLLARASAVNTNKPSGHPVHPPRAAVTFSDIFSPTQSDRIASSLCGKCHNNTNKNNAFETSQELSNDVRSLETESELPDASWNTTWSSVKETETSKLDNDFDETFKSVDTPAPSQEPIKCHDNKVNTCQQSESRCPSQGPIDIETGLKQGGVSGNLADEAAPSYRIINPDTLIQEKKDRTTTEIIKGGGESVPSSSKVRDTKTAEWVEMTDPQTGKQLFVNSKSGATVYGDNFKGHTPPSTETVSLDRLFSAPGSVRLKPSTTSTADTSMRLKPSTSSTANTSPAPNGDIPVSPEEERPVDGPVAEMVANFLQQDEDEAEVKWRSPPRDLAQAETSKVSSIDTLFQEWNNPVLYCPEKEVQTAEVSGLPSRAVVNAYKSMHTCTFTKDMLHTVQVVGQLDKKFIACLINTKQDLVDTDGPDLLAVIDQHAAHERVRLEMLTEEAYEDADKVRGQLCVYSVSPAKTLALTEDEVRVMVTYREELKRIGIQFDVSAESRSTVHVRSVPDCLVVKAEPSSKRKSDYIYWETVEALIRDHVELLRSTSGARGMFPKVIHKILCSLACHGAIKFGDPLTQRECEALVADLGRCDLPFQCAHGRPSVMPVLQLEQLETSLKQQKPKPPKLYKLTEALMARKDAA